MEERTGGAGDAVGFHRNIGEGAGSDDVARSVLHFHRDGYVLEASVSRQLTPNMAFLNVLRFMSLMKNSVRYW